MSNKKRKYNSMKELASAFASGEINKNEYVLVLDNDTSFLRYIGPIPNEIDFESPGYDSWIDEKNDEAMALFRGNGYIDLLDACLAAGIPAEWC